MCYVEKLNIEIMKQSNLTRLTCSESRHGLPSSVIHAILMRVTCPNTVSFRVQWLVSKQRAQELDTSVWAREGCLSIVNVTGLSD